MKFVLASYGTRGDVEPCAAVGRELLRRGHEVLMAVPHNMLGFVESVGLAAVAFGPDAKLSDEDLIRFSNIPNPISMLCTFVEYATQLWLEMSTTLVSLAQGADLLLTGMGDKQGLAANVAEYYRIPLATLHCYPIAEFPSMPATLSWLDRHITKEVEDAQRRALGLPPAPGPAPPGIDRGPLQIQAYDEICFPERAAQSAQDGERRPFVGALTLELPTDADKEVLSWIAAGTPPIYFGFGSTRVEAFGDKVAMISSACSELGERALIHRGVHGREGIQHSDHVKVVGTLNFAAIFPACRAVVHHGGAGTTAAGLRAGIPTLILWVGHDQPIWADTIERLNVGRAQPISTTTRESLVRELRSILAPRTVRRARNIATFMTNPAESVARSADLLEGAARRERIR
ncbi:glycosyltransferase [Mycobacterium heckeshornense]|uniref:Putative glycosyltransferase n=1 Tax=Mycobacterium heckeshornense TaxID=110505 RepID=A0A2G8BDH0_9MYCO|nr:glycosyltransferase [Mycobacterium heckeshornense]KMV20946.1 glycosyltransferase [Mycobacterium heckeshornense]MCV7036229.1 glycosyltransferase [Mycobacterium heckeshornense]PIJ35809.1 glycosyltransferase [Mycobacterium heckeshornense]BCO35985.1 putative glycosyltransferase [Mycobacterium heckeshornense]